MTKYRSRCFFNDAEYQLIRRASMRGDIRASFSRDAEGVVTFTTDNHKRLCADLERIIDFGATTAAEVLLDANFRGATMQRVFSSARELRSYHQRSR